jgi:hypothetical protein
MAAKRYGTSDLLYRGEKQERKRNKNRNRKKKRKKWGK